MPAAKIRKTNLFVFPTSFVNNEFWCASPPPPPPFLYIRVVVLILLLR